MRLHPQKHPSHIWIGDDRNRWRLFIFELIPIFSLESFPHIIHGIQICRRGMDKRLKPDRQSGFVHHVKHDPHSLVFFTKQQTPTNALASERHAAGDAGVDPHLLLHPGADDIIRIAQRSRCPWFRAYRPPHAPEPDG